MQAADLPLDKERPDGVGSIVHQRLPVDARRTIDFPCRKVGKSGLGLPAMATRAQDGQMSCVSNVWIVTN